MSREMLNIWMSANFRLTRWWHGLPAQRRHGCVYGDRTLKVKALENYDFSDVDIC